MLNLMSRNESFSNVNNLRLVAFIFIALFGMYPGRRLGWALCRSLLYSAPLIVVAVTCIVWGALIAYLIHLLIAWQHPHWISKWIFGFALGAYVSVPNYGLLIESSVPEHAATRHFVISNFPYLIFIICSVVFAYLL